MIDERLGDSSRTLTQTQQNYPESDSRVGSSVRRDPTPLPPPNLDPPITQSGVKKCTYKDFMVCRPKEFKGEKDPKVVVRWITEMEQVLYICRCKDNMKVGFACQMLKDDALIWWNNLREAIGSEGISSLTWNDFVTRLKGKFCSPRHQQKLVNDFFSLHKGSMSIDEYTKKFTDMLPFLGDTLPNEQGRVNRYLSGLPGDYFVEVGKANTLDEAIEAATRVEDMLAKKASERVNVGERLNVEDKMKFVGASGFSKKGRSSSNFPKKDCKKCGKCHGGECRSGTMDCFQCGRPGHKAVDCKVKEGKEVECYKCHEKGHYSAQCPKCKVKP